MNVPFVSGSARFDAMAASHGGRSALLRGLVDQALRNPQEEVVVPSPRERTTARVEVRLTATDIERLDGKEVGTAGDPRLTAYGPGKILTDAGKRTTLSRYQLRPGSPLAGAGINLRELFGIEAGDCDFWGNPLPKNRPAAVGAHAGPEQ